MIEQVNGYDDVCGDEQQDDKKCKTKFSPADVNVMRVNGHKVRDDVRARQEDVNIRCDDVCS